MQAQDPESLRCGGASVQHWPRAPFRGDRSRLRRCARARGRAACDAPRAPGTASHLAQRSWVEPRWRALATRESNTFSLNFPAPVPANTHSRTHTRAPRACHRRADWHRWLSGRVFLSPSLLLARRLLFYLFISSSWLHPPAPHLPPCLFLLPLSPPQVSLSPAVAVAPAAAMRACRLVPPSSRGGAGTQAPWEGGAPRGRGHPGVFACCEAGDECQ